MKVQLIGIALLLFMILMKLTGNSLDAFCVLGGFVGLIIVMLGKGMGDDK